MHESVGWLYDLQHFGVKLGLDNILGLLRMLGHPERAYPSIHVAGTNGKGSVAAMLDAMLGAHGLRAGMFTSPHLVRPNERIRIGGADVADDELHAALAAMRERIDAALESGELVVHPSFFETLTATALQAFRERGVEAAVLEVGLGGRLDATNAVAADVGVIVGIDLDHTKTLGSTLEEIAGEKAGIVKHGMPVVHGVTQQAALDVVNRVCAEREARAIDARLRVALAGDDGERLSLRGAHGLYEDLRLALPGRHQIDNARIAVCALELLFERIDRAIEPAAVREGLAGVRWPGRLQWIDAHDGVPAMLFDGAHNAAGLRCLLDYLAGCSRRDPVILFGAASGKPLGTMLAGLATVSQRIVLTRPPVDRGVDPHMVAEIAQEHFAEVTAIDEPAKALEHAAGLCAADDYLLVTGSLYLVGEILGLLSQEPVPGPVAM